MSLPAVPWKLYAQHLDDFFTPEEQLQVADMWKQSTADHLRQQNPEWDASALDTFVGDVQKGIRQKWASNLDNGGLVGNENPLELGAMAGRAAIDQTKNAAVGAQRVVNNQLDDEIINNSLDTTRGLFSIDPDGAPLTVSKEGIVSEMSLSLIHI